jgi:hypothetical protein
MWNVETGSQPVVRQDGREPPGSRLLPTAWTRLRRLVASLMLVAAASLVLHGGAMAALHGHGPGSAACDAAHGHGAHGHAHPATHVHGGHSHGSHHAAAHQAAGPELDLGADLGAASPADAPEPDAAGLPCCASACTVALVSPGPAASPAPPARAPAPLAAAQRGAGIDPHGLKRPPRPLCTA